MKGNLGLSKTEIPYILRNRNKLKATIHKKMRRIKRDLENSEDLYKAASYSSPRVSDMPSGSGRHKELGDVLEKYEKIRRQQIRDLRTLFFKLAMEEEKIERVWVCFLLLEDPAYGIIEDMYIKGEKYESAELRSGYSRQVFEKYRKRGVEDILHLYESEMSMEDLQKMIQPYGNVRRERCRSEDRNDYQITLDDLIGKKEKEAYHETD